MKALVIIGLLFVAGCAGTAEVRATNSLAIACDSFATALDQITPFRREGKLSAENVKRVDAAIAATSPVCKSDSVVDPASAVGVVRQGIDLINQVRGSI